MRLHNCLLDYRETDKYIQHLIYERTLFQEDINNSHATHIQTGTNLGCPQGNIGNDEKMYRRKGMAIIDVLRKILAEHDMHRKTKHRKCDNCLHTYYLTGT